MSAEPSSRQTFRQLIQEHFTLQELEDLCFDLTIDHEELGGDTLSKSTRVVRLIKYSQKHGRLPDLLSHIQKARPHLTWPTDLANKLLGIEPGQLVNVPLLPPHFLPREEELAALREKVLADSAVPVGVTGYSKAVGVQGMGGIGKSVLAAALARDTAVQERFPDGIIWLELGQEPNLVARQVQLAQALSDEMSTFTDSQQGRSYLDRLLKHTTCLVILDDVWQVNDVDAFPLMEGQNRLLITTRDIRLVQIIGAMEYQLGILSEEAALILLATKVGIVLGGALPAEAKPIAKECGYLPLALAMIGGMIANRPNGWQYALERLQRADLSRIYEKFPNYPYPNLFKALDVSVMALGQGDELTGLQPIERYLDLAVFPEEVAIPMAVLETFWQPLGLDALDVADLVNEWVSRSLGSFDEQGHLRLHDLQRDYVRMSDGLLKRHEQLLVAYIQRCPTGWASGPNDGYFFQHLLYHLRGAKRQSELEQLLLRFAWLQAKLKATDIFSLVADYDQTIENARLAPLALVQRALRLSANVLMDDKGKLCEQLLGRLLTFNTLEITSFLAEVKMGSGVQWLRPLRGSLVTPAETLVHSLEGHIYAVRSVVVSPNNQWIVSGADDCTVRVWELATGRLNNTLKGHTKGVNSVAVSPDNQWIISGADDCTVRVWELATGQLYYTIESHRDKVRSVIVSPNNQWIVSGSSDWTVKVWELITGRLQYALKGHTKRVNSVVVSSDNQWVISASNDGTMKVWELGTGQLHQTLKGHTYALRSVAISPDNRWVISASNDGTVKIWEFTAGQLYHTQKTQPPRQLGSVQELGTRWPYQTMEKHTRGIRSVMVSPDNRWVVSGAGDGAVKMWELATGQLHQALRGHVKGVNSVVISPDNRWIVSGSNDRTVRVSELATEQSHHTLERHTDWVRSLATSPDNRWVVSGADDRTVRVWELATGRIRHTLKRHIYAVRSVVVSPDSQWVVSGSNDRTVRVWELATGQLYRTLEGHTKGVNSIVVSSNNLWIVSGSSDNTIKVWELATGLIYHTLEGHTKWINSVIISPDNQWVVSGSGDSTIKVWELATGQLHHTLEGHGVMSVVISPDSQWVVYGSGDDTVKVGELATGRMRHTLKGHVKGISSVMVSPDSQWLVSGSRDSTIKVWELATGRLHHTLTGHTDWIGSVVVSPNSQWVVSGAVDRTVKAWEISTKQQIATFTADFPITSLTVAPDSRTIIAGDRSGQVHFLYLEGVD